MQKSLGVLNDIKLKGFHEEPKRPTLQDDAVDGQTPDVLVIGGGIVGCAVARELTRLDVSVLLVEKCNDVACGASSRNDGCIHPGIDLHKGQQNSNTCLRAIRLIPRLPRSSDFNSNAGRKLLFFHKMGECNYSSALQTSRQTTRR